MRLMPVWALRPGMEVAKRVNYGEGAPLLNAGVKLQAEYIQQLKRLDVRAVYIHDSLIPDVQVEDVILEETRERAIGLVRSTLNDLKEDNNSKFTRLLTVKKELTGILDDIVNQLLSNKNLTVNLSDIRYTDNYTFSHSVNVAVLSIMTAITLGMRKSELKNLGLGAFLHDLGKVLIPLSILNKQGRLTDNEMEEMKRHPAYGLDLVKTRHLFNGPSLSIILKHHERVNGSGYPQGLTGDEMELYPKICAVTDVYDALVSDRPYRPGFMPHRAMEIIETEAEGYDLQVLQTFYHHVSAYPIGTFIGLNNGVVGVVVNNRHGHPTRPTVRVISRKDDFEPLQHYEIDLLETLNLVVDRVYQDHEVPGHIYYRESS
jgi:HD-GYP domain-containing protein (c-di-GMP phosphodiesterase class II)